MKYSIPWCLIFLYLMLAACGSSNKEVEAVNKAGVYFSTFQELPFKELEIGKLYQDEISTGSDVFDFDDGKSFFLAYQLPRSKEDYQLTISSYKVEEHLNKAAIFFPTILVLDENYELILKLGGENFEFKSTPGTDVKGGGGASFKYETTVTLGSLEANERYLVIYTTQAQMKQYTSIKSMKVVPIIDNELRTIPVDKDDKWIRHSPLGRIRLELKKYQTN